ncbi:MAG: hypothetical protein IKR17_05945 [Bacteroidales bacterium]|nr:hypothetical protein [Bacteroidales bacterium]
MYEEEYDEKAEFYAEERRAEAREENCHEEDLSDFEAYREHLAEQYRRGRRWFGR